METKLITIKEGRKVRVRALKPSDTSSDHIIQRGDCWDSGDPVSQGMIGRAARNFNMNGGRLQIYRPLKSKPRTAKARFKTIAAWAIVNKRTGKMRVAITVPIYAENGCESHERIEPVTISYRKKK